MKTNKRGYMSKSKGGFVKKLFLAKPPRTPIFLHPVDF